MDDLALLRLQIEWGADEALGDEPRDQFAPVVPSRVPSASSGAGPVLVASQPAPVALAPAVPVMRAAEQAAAVSDIEALHRTVDGFEACPLRATASTTVAPSGNPASGLVLIAEAPGPDDDRAGLAFSGAAGERLDRILSSAGLTRADLLLTFLVPWRPPGGRPPNEAELAQCLPFLHRLLALARPRHLVLLGATPLRVLTNGGDNLRKARGKWTAVAVPGLDAAVPALPMLAPELWLSTAKNKQAAWSDLLLLKEALALSSVRF